MGFLKPKVPKPDPAPNQPVDPIDTSTDMKNEFASAPTSLIRTSGSGLKRKPMTQRTSLIGG